MTLEQLAMARAKQSLKPEVFENQTDTAFEVGLGILIAEHLNQDDKGIFDEDTILRIAANAFEHNNEHGQAQKVRELKNTH